MTRWERLLAWEDEHRFAVDCLLAGVLLLLVLPGSVTISGGFSGLTVPRLKFEPAAWFAAMIAVGTAVPLAWRRVAPALSAALVYGVVLFHMLAGLPVAIVRSDGDHLTAVWA